MRLRSIAATDGVAASTAAGVEAPADPHDNRIGAVLVQTGHLRPKDVEDVLDRQASGGLMFGETAVAMGLISPDVLDETLRRQRGGELFHPGDDRISPMIVTAYDLEHGYAARVRAIRSSIVRRRPDGTSAIASCVLIGVDCDEELAVLAANLGVLMVHMGTPTLLMDADRRQSRIHDLFRMSSSAGTALVDGIGQPTPVPRLWLTPEVASEQSVPERQPLMHVASRWKRAGTQILASLPVERDDSAASIAEAVSGMGAALLIARRHVTAVDQLRRMIDAMDERSVPIVGMVMV